MLERKLLPGGQNVLHHLCFSLAVSAWFEITPEVSENSQRNAKQKVTFWLPETALGYYLVPKRMKKTLLVKIGASFTVSPGRGAW